MANSDRWGLLDIFLKLNLNSNFFYKSYADTEHPSGIIYTMIHAVCAQPNCIIRWCNKSTCQKQCPQYYPIELIVTSSVHIVQTGHFIELQLAGHPVQSLGSPVTTVESRCETIFSPPQYPHPGVKIFSPGGENIRGWKYHITQEKNHNRRVNISQCASQKLCAAVRSSKSFLHDQS